jgi:hypothetical protein
MSRRPLLRRTDLKARHLLLPVGLVCGLLAATSCDLPFGLGLPSTRAVENGAVSTLDAARSLELSGTYVDAGQTWKVDLQLARPDVEHAVVDGPPGRLEAIVLGKDGYFRGQDFLSQHMGADPVSRDLVKAAGNGWWRGSTANAPKLPELTDGSAFRAAFLGPAATQRSDHVAVAGVSAVVLSGPRGQVFIDEASPYRLLRVRIRKGASIDGLAEADLRYMNFDRDFGVKAPGDVIDFSNLSTLPPIYTVVSVDASRCAGTPCVVSALLKNLGATSGAVAPSTVTFELTDAASGKVVGSCRVPIRPDVPYNATTTASCTISIDAGQAVSAAMVTATPDNPGRG